jgi:Tol biopolymer transport system component
MLTRPQQITATVGTEAYPTWSPDGSRIPYTGLTGGDNWDIWVSQVSGGPPVNLTSDHDGADMLPELVTGRIADRVLVESRGRGRFVMSALGDPTRKITGVWIFGRVRASRVVARW